MNAELAAKLNGRRVIASVSGGKDSAAMSLWLHEQGIEHDRVFMDTGWEHPATYEYLRGPLTEKIGPIAEIRSQEYPRGMPELVQLRGMFPSRKRRMCTDELKKRPIIEYISKIQDKHGDVVNCVGIRAQESKARSVMLEWEESKEFDCDVWRPLLDWSEQQVVEIHTRHGLAPNPLYLRGAERVGCYPCIFSAKSEIRRVADADPWRIDEIERLEAFVLERAEARYAATGETLASKELSAPAFFQAQGALRGEGRDGRCVPIREVVAWSRTAHGGKQFELFAADDRDAGCMRWGLCETNPEAE